MWNIYQIVKRMVSTLLMSLIVASSQVPMCTYGEQLVRGISRTYSCQKCTQGRYMPFKAHLKMQCEVCPIGKYNLETGMSSCQKVSPCPSGYYQYTNTSGIHHCAPCPNGTFSVSHLSLTCKVCPEGKYQPLIAQNNCLLEPSCQTFHYWDQDLFVCRKCHPQIMVLAFVCWFLFAFGGVLVFCAGQPRAILSSIILIPICIVTTDCSKMSSLLYDVLIGVCGFCFTINMYVWWRLARN